MLVQVATSVDTTISNMPATVAQGLFIALGFWHLSRSFRRFHISVPPTFLVLSASSTCALQLVGSACGVAAAGLNPCSCPTLIDPILGLLDLWRPPQTTMHKQRPTTTPCMRSTAQGTGFRVRPPRGLAWGDADGVQQHPSTFEYFYLSQPLAAKYVAAVEQLAQPFFPGTVPGLTGRCKLLVGDSLVNLTSASEVFEVHPLQLRLVLICKYQTDP